LRGSIRIVDPLVVLAVAALSMADFDVTDSWCSDSGYTDVSIVVQPMPSIESSFSFDNAYGSESDGVIRYIVPQGPRSLNVIGEGVGFRIVDGSLAMNGSTYSIGDELVFPTGTSMFAVVSEQIVLEPLS